ncbi:MAG: enoyl-CoA hydratase/isomerase family protein [Acidobacteriota bacterium]
MPESSPAVICSQEGSLTVLRMQGRHGNAINLDLMDGLGAALQEARRNSSIKGVLLASASKLFCPGLDLPELIDLDRPAMERFMARFTGLVLDLCSFPRPLVAAVSGHAVAGGCVLALTADWRILRSGSRIGLHEVQVGVPLPFEVTLLLRAAVNGNHLSEIALLGRDFTGEDARQAGLVQEVHDPEGFEAHCLARLEEFAEKNSEALATTKRYLRASLLESMRAEAEAHRAEFLDGWFAPDARRRAAAIAAGLGKRG